MDFFEYRNYTAGDGLGFLFELGLQGGEIDRVWVGCTLRLGRALVDGWENIVRF